MREDLMYAYRNDPFALSMIDSYVSKFHSYSPEEQQQLLLCADTLFADFEIYVNLFDLDEADFDAGVS